ncbi:MAG: L,D-transpeptidase [Candidatus Coatesbacteria bacterium]|nr:L,D-transpeptidase [Candidatus Coatesbacteria bacterium]
MKPIRYVILSFSICMILSSCNLLSKSRDNDIPSYSQDDEKRMFAYQDLMKNKQFISQAKILELERENAKLKLQNEALKNQGYYLVIDQTEMRYYLRRGDKLIRSGVVALGKGETQVGSTTFKFYTPTGAFNILYKQENPWWHRPPWYWKEKGKAYPDSIIKIPRNLNPGEARKMYNELTEEEKDRVTVVPGELGKYKMGLGDGIFIHYGKELGRNASHGCIRVGKADLEILYKYLKVGDPVFVY